MEAVKDGFTRRLGNAGAFVVDADPDLVADAAGGNLDQAARRREADRIVDDIVDRPGEPARIAHYDRALAARPSEGNPRVAFLAAIFPCRDQLFDQRSQIDRLKAGDIVGGLDARDQAEAACPTNPRE